MDSDLRTRLRQELQIGGWAYVRNIAAAETAVLQGQFNVAKILRAAGHSQRQLAMNAARLLQPQIDAESLFMAILHELDLVADDVVVEDVEFVERDVETFLARAATVRQRLRDILQRGLASLAGNPDVLESDVHIFLWACYGCGNLYEGERPSQCDLCGAPAIEMQFFGPYYANSPERLGRLLPPEIITTLAATPDDLAATVLGVANERLERKPTPAEWSVKELIAHLIETDQLLLHEVEPVLASTEPVPIFPPWSTPWKTHEGKGYERMSITDLVQRFRQGRIDVLALFQNLEWEQWSRKGARPDVQISILDLGRWLANHDIGHMAQIRRQCEVERAGSG